MAMHICPNCGYSLDAGIPQTADAAIERYYRIKAQGGKTTLRQLSAMTGYSHDYLRQRKVEYDRAGKWGAKNKATP